MASSRSRQRALARAKVERQIARRAASARRRRQWQAGIGGALALVLVSVGAVWANGGFDPEPKSSADCAWTTVDSTTALPRKDVGKPPTTGIRKAGGKTMTITTNQGVITALLDPTKAACTVASFSHLASKQFFDNTGCHRLTTAGIFVLQCGDPSGTGSGGPTYRFPDENLPQPLPADPSASPGPSADPSATPAPKAKYSRGVLAMANNGADTNGSQFFLVYNDTTLEPKYTVFGTITGGLDLIEKVAAAGVAPGQDGAPSTDGKPNTEVKIVSLTVSDGPAPSAPSSVPTSGAPAPPPSPTPSGSGTSKP